ncbi:DNA alkylation repair protein [Virgibacillus sp. W0430]|uniref:DNA alkylation repair protein n=1 Tax=Virgibacillus sp. W0430 TaxID=3391580 RepID=UPI003F4579F4
MSKSYRCPNCKTNRTRFNIIEQVDRSVKLDPHSGDIITEFTSNNMDPFHMAYNGPKYRIQCGACGLIENEHTFIKYASYDT